MPELPEAERARQQIERALGRTIEAVDDADTYVCRPHAPGEIAGAFAGRTLTSAHRRGKFLWVETDDGDGPVLGLHLGMAGSIKIDTEPAPNHWDRFAIDFADGGRLALRDKRRLGRAVLEPGLLARRPGRRRGRRRRVPRAGRPGRRAAEGEAAGPGRGGRHRQPARRPGPVAGQAVAPSTVRRADADGARPPAPQPAPGASRTPSSTAGSTPGASSPTASAAAPARGADPAWNGPRSAVVRPTGARRNKSNPHIEAESDRKSVRWDEIGRASGDPCSSAALWVPISDGTCSCASCKRPWSPPACTWRCSSPWARSRRTPPRAPTRPLPAPPRRASPPRRPRRRRPPAPTETATTAPVETATQAPTQTATPTATVATADATPTAQPSPTATPKDEVDELPTVAEQDADSARGRGGQDHQGMRRRPPPP